ncbi:tRNA (adenosine(37)-N6)-dimethylallyltransferase MiaA [Sphingobacterium deserti]|uniref:tRNA dimethylallyltransferase n=1 Tax=Sphingobacterium deserti TaxID=1229276 RepID=A0A0B8T4D9_9SPHI|nr:tRNA (adenosine(37)-N6)-dimethylallyltransferase MiaA [Sphingobacterium deserti]KGE14508.1 tRNA delta(2)-isopentenylpyrophosphate transferase [Sphingobacterium deserti]
MIEQTIDHIDNNQVSDLSAPDFLCVILGPTASGKTALGVALAERLFGEIISIDSRQVYRGMDIGTGKDLSSYRDIPYHLIDIQEPHDRYDISQFKVDFHHAFTKVVSKGKVPIAVGGTGLYMHTLLLAQPYTQVPVDESLRQQLLPLDKITLIQRLENYQIPANFKIDQSSHKRLIRAIEILEQLKAGYQPVEEKTRYKPIIFGLNPSVDARRQSISERLTSRLNEGLIEEVEQLLMQGLSHNDLQYFGLEYKYSSLYLLGELDKSSFYTKLETEIHRYAKRQMTFFRKMEKDGIKIHWLDAVDTAERLDAIERIIKKDHPKGLDSPFSF